MRYRAYNLVVESDLAIPGAQPEARGTDSSESDLRQLDLRVTVGRAAGGVAVRSEGPYTLCADGSLEFFMPGVARYRIDADARGLMVDPVERADVDDVCAMLVATALPCWLWTRGDMVLHAAAAVPRGSSRAVALAGPSGSGKSTGLRRLLAEGEDVLADDTLRLWSHAGEVWVSGLPAALQMRAVAEVSVPAGGPPARQWVAVPAQRQRRSATLSSVLIQGGTGTASRQPVRLTGAAALIALRRNLHRATAARLLGLEPGLLPRLAAILRTVAIYQADRA